MKIEGTLARFLIKFIEIWATPIIRFRVGSGVIEIGIDVSADDGAGIDERIAHIDEARTNLASALSAVDELKATAQRNKLELQDALQRIEEVSKHKDAAEKDLENIKQIAQADIEVFRKLAGVPSRKEIAIERLIVFIIGFSASALASGILWFITS